MSTQCFFNFFFHFNKPHEVPEEYKRKTERNLAATPALKIGVKQEEIFDVKKVSKSHTVSHGKVKIDESIKNDLKLKAQVKVNVKKGALHKTDVFQSKEDIAALLKLKEAKVRISISYGEVIEFNLGAKVLVLGTMCIR